MADQLNLDQGSLADLLDRLVDTGIAASGDLVLGLADVDLIRVSLRLVLGSVDKLAGAPDPDGRPWPAEPPTAAGPPITEPADPPIPAGSPASTTRSAPTALPPRTGPAARPATGAAGVDLDHPADRPVAHPDRPELGVGALLVAVVEIVHQLLERQAIRRMERGSLSDEQIERLGLALMEMQDRIGQLVELFGVRSGVDAPPARTAPIGARLGGQP